MYFVHTEHLEKYSHHDAHVSWHKSTCTEVCYLIKIYKYLQTTHNVAILNIRMHIVLCKSQLIGWSIHITNWRQISWMDLDSKENEGITKVYQNSQVICTKRKILNINVHIFWCMNKIKFKKIILNVKIHIFWCMSWLRLVHAKRYMSRKFNKHRKNIMNKLKLFVILQASSASSCQ